MNEQNFGTNPVKINEIKNHDFIKEENKIVKPEVSSINYFTLSGLYGTMRGI